MDIFVIKISQLLLSQCRYLIRRHRLFVVLTRDCTVCEWTDSQIFFGQNYPSTNEFVYHLPNGLVSSGDDCVLEGEGRDKRNCVYFIYNNYV